MAREIINDEKHKQAREYYHQRMQNPEIQNRVYELAKKRRETNLKKSIDESVPRKIISNSQESKYAWRRNNLEKMRAEVYAFRYVSLKSSCEVCGGTEGLQKHHPDYSKPLEVVTLCEKCHEIADKVRQLTTVQRTIVLANRHCLTCNLTHPKCGRSRPSFKGYGCALWIEKVALNNTEETKKVSN